MDEKDPLEEINDNIEDLELLGLGRYFQSLADSERQTRESALRSKEAEATRRLLRENLAYQKSIAAEAEKRRREQAALPDCPECHGKISCGCRRCKHCAVELAWIGNRVCVRGAEATLEAAIAEELEEQEKFRKRMAEAERLERERNYLAGRDLLAILEEEDRQGLACPICRSKKNPMNPVCSQCTHQPDKDKQFWLSYWISYFSCLVLFCLYIKVKGDSISIPLIIGAAICPSPVFAFIAQIPLSPIVGRWLARPGRRLQAVKYAKYAKPPNHLGRR